MFSCETIVSELPASYQLGVFNEWGLHMSELGRHTNLLEDTPLPKVFLAMLSAARNCKQCASAVQDEDASADEDADATTSAVEGDEESESRDDSPPKIRLSIISFVSLHVPSFFSGDAAKSSLPWELRSSGQRTSFPSAAMTSSGLSILLPSNPPKKVTKTRPGSVKDEPVSVTTNSCKPHTMKPSHIDATAPSDPTTLLADLNTVTIKKKKHPVLKAHVYEKDVPVPIKTEELDAVMQVSALPSYGCMQCSSSVQNQPCLFLGWGKRCNNCAAATKSLCSFCAEPIQRYLAHKELAKFVEATPENVCACIDHASAALHVFESSANATAHVAQQFCASLEGLSDLCRSASGSEGKNALLGVVFEDGDFEDRIRTALHESDQHVSFLSNVAREPSLPLDHGPSSPPLVMTVSQASSPAGSQAGSLVEGNEVSGELNQLESLPVRPATDGSPMVT
ncbi:hypothetical protein IW262DRAFT_1468337 [Armillaria fumosa]|nr:hypothetical protein IW262DRAFT_1468337 [Armillaria fumosa]